MAFNLWHIMAKAILKIVLQKIYSVYELFEIYIYMQIYAIYTVPIYTYIY